MAALAAALASATIASNALAAEGTRLDFPDTSDLELVGKWVVIDDYLRIAGKSIIGLSEGRYAEPVEVIFDLASRTPDYRRLKEPAGSQNLKGEAAVLAFSEDAAGSSLSISRDGFTIVGYIDNGAFTPYHAFRWTEASGIVDLGTLDPPNNANRSSFAHDVSNDGAVVAGYSSTSGVFEHAFRWTEADGMVDLGTGFGTGTDQGSRAFGVSGDGSMVVGESAFPPPPGSFFNTTRAFRWTPAGGVQSIGALEDFGNSLASAVSADAAVIVGHASVTETVGNTQTARARLSLDRGWRNAKPRRAARARLLLLHRRQ